MEHLSSTCMKGWFGGVVIKRFKQERFRDFSVGWVHDNEYLVRQRERYGSLVVQYSDFKDG